MDWPKSLHVLWQEWEPDLDGKKPVHLFTEEEQGKDRQKYSRRQVVWDKNCRVYLARAIT